MVDPSVNSHNLLTETRKRPNNMDVIHKLKKPKLEMIATPSTPTTVV
jgi:hypothetical protein